MDPPLETYVCHEQEGRPPGKPENLLDIAREKLEELGDTSWYSALEEESTLIALSRRPHPTDLDFMI